MAFDMTELVIIVVIIIVIFVILAACCRGLRRAYEDHVATEDLARRRQAFFINQAARGRSIHPNPNNVPTAVRVTTISREGDTIAMGVYEIHVPRRGNDPGNPGAANIRPQRFRPPLDPSPEYQPPSIEDPPPSYDDYVKCSSKNSQNVNNDRY